MLISSFFACPSAFPQTVDGWVGKSSGATNLSQLKTSWLCKSSILLPTHYVTKRWRSCMKLRRISHCMEYVIVWNTLWPIKRNCSWWSKQILKCFQIEIRAVKMAVTSVLLRHAYVFYALATRCFSLCRLTTAISKMAVSTARSFKKPTLLCELIKQSPHSVAFSIVDEW